jgi:putative aldouronate transport system substrate-binding protein
MLLEYGGEQEVFLPLNDYIEEYGHWTQRMFETAIIDNLEKRMKTADGKIYYIPYYVEQTGNLWSNKAWINRVWLDNLGLDMPKTTEDFKRVLQAIKSGDPNGNGKEDEIPYTGSINGMKEETFPFLMNSFIYCDYENYFLDNAGKVEAAYIKPEWKEGLKYMRELAAEGLFDTQSLSQDTQTLRTLLRNTDAAIVGSFAGNSIDLQMGVDSPRLADYQGLAPLEGPKGVAYSTRGPGNPSINYGGVITKYCSNPEAAFRLMDFMLSEEASMRARYGVPGVDWEEPQEGDICMFENIGAEPYVRPILAYGSVQNSHWQSTHPVFRHRAMSDGMVWDGDPLNGEYIKAQALSLYINKAPEKTIDKMTFTIEEMNEFESLKQLIRGYVRENVAMFITGEKDIEKDWDNYLDELNRMGLNKMLDLAQTGYDRFNQS